MLPCTEHTHYATSLFLPHFDVICDLFNTEQSQDNMEYLFVKFIMHSLILLHYSKIKHGRE